MSRQGGKKSRKPRGPPPPPPPRQSTVKEQLKEHQQQHDDLLLQHQEEQQQQDQHHQHQLRQLKKQWDEQAQHQQRKQEQEMRELETQFVMEQQKWALEQQEFYRQQRAEFGYGEQHPHEQPQQRQQQTPESQPQQQQQRQSDDWSHELLQQWDQVMASSEDLPQQPTSTPLEQPHQQQHYGELQQQELAADDASVQQEFIPPPMEFAHSQQEEQKTISTISQPGQAPDPMASTYPHDISYTQTVVQEQQTTTTLPTITSPSTQPDSGFAGPAGFAGTPDSTVPHAGFVEYQQKYGEEYGAFARQPQLHGDEPSNRAAAAGWQRPGGEEGVCVEDIGEAVLEPRGVGYGAEEEGVRRREVPVLTSLPVQITSTEHTKQISPSPTITTSGGTPTSSGTPMSSLEQQYSSMESVSSGPVLLHRAGSEGRKPPSRPISQCSDDSTSSGKFKPKRTPSQRDIERKLEMQGFVVVQTEEPSPTQAKQSRMTKPPPSPYHQPKTSHHPLPSPKGHHSTPAHQGHPPRSPQGHQPKSSSQGHPLHGLPPFPKGHQQQWRLDQEQEVATATTEGQKAIEESRRHRQREREKFFAVVGIEKPDPDKPMVKEVRPGVFEVDRSSMEDVRQFRSGGDKEWKSEGERDTEESETEPEERRRSVRDLIAEHNKQTLKNIARPVWRSKSSITSSVSSLTSSNERLQKQSSLTSSTELLQQQPGGVSESVTYKSSDSIQSDSGAVSVTKEEHKQETHTSGDTSTTTTTVTTVRQKTREIATHGDAEHQEPSAIISKYREIAGVPSDIQASEGQSTEDLTGQDQAEGTSWVHKKVSALDPQAEWKYRMQRERKRRSADISDLVKDSEGHDHTQAEVDTSGFMSHRESILRGQGRRSATPTKPGQQEVTSSQQTHPSWRHSWHPESPGLNVGSQKSSSQKVSSRSSSSHSVQSQLDAEEIQRIQSHLIQPASDMVQTSPICMLSMETQTDFTPVPSPYMMDPSVSLSPVQRLEDDVDVAQISTELVQAEDTQQTQSLGEESEQTQLNQVRLTTDLLADPQLQQEVLTGSVISGEIKEGECKDEDIAELAAEREEVLVKTDYVTTETKSSVVTMETANTEVTDGKQLKHLQEQLRKSPSAEEQGKNMLQELDKNTDREEQLKKDQEEVMGMEAEDSDNKVTEASLMGGTSYVVSEARSDSLEATGEIESEISKASVTKTCVAPNQPSAVLLHESETAHSYVEQEIVKPEEIKTDQPSQASHPEVELEVLYLQEKKSESAEKERKQAETIETTIFHSETNVQTETRVVVSQQTLEDAVDGHKSDICDKLPDSEDITPPPVPKRVSSMPTKALPPVAPTHPPTPSDDDKKGGNGGKKSVGPPPPIPPRKPKVMIQDGKVIKIAETSSVPPVPVRLKPKVEDLKIKPELAYMRKSSSFDDDDVFFPSREERYPYEQTRIIAPDHGTTSPVGKAGSTSPLGSPRGRPPFDICWVSTEVETHVRHPSDLDDVIESPEEEEKEALMQQPLGKSGQKSSEHVRKPGPVPPPIPQRKQLRPPAPAEDHPEGHSDLDATLDSVIEEALSNQAQVRSPSTAEIMMDVLGPSGAEQLLGLSAIPEDEEESADSLGKLSSVSQVDKGDYASSKLTSPPEDKAPLNKTKAMQESLSEEVYRGEYEINDSHVEESNIIIPSVALNELQDRQRQDMNRQPEVGTGEDSQKKIVMKAKQTQSSETKYMVKGGKGEPTIPQEPHEEPEVTGANSDQAASDLEDSDMEIIAVGEEVCPLIYSESEESMDGLDGPFVEVPETPAVGEADTDHTINRMFNRIWELHGQPSQDYDETTDGLVEHPDSPTLPSTSEDVTALMGEMYEEIVPLKNEKEKQDKLITEEQSYISQEGQVIGSAGETVQPIDSSQNFNTLIENMPQHEEMAQLQSKLTEEFVVLEELNDKTDEKNFQPKAQDTATLHRDPDLVEYEVVTTDKFQNDVLAVTQLDQDLSPQPLHDLPLTAHVASNIKIESTEKMQSKSSRHTTQYIETDLDDFEHVQPPDQQPLNTAEEAKRSEDYNSRVEKLDRDVEKALQSASDDLVFQTSQQPRPKTSQPDIIKQVVTIEEHHDQEAVDIEITHYPAIMEGFSDDFPGVKRYPAIKDGTSQEDSINEVQMDHNQSALMGEQKYAIQGQEQMVPPEWSQRFMPGDYVDDFDSSLDPVKMEIMAKSQENLFFVDSILYEIDTEEAPREPLRYERSTLKVAKSAELLLDIDDDQEVTQERLTSAHSAEGLPIDGMRVYDIPIGSKSEDNILRATSSELKAIEDSIRELEEKTIAVEHQDFRYKEGSMSVAKSQELLHVAELAEQAGCTDKVESLVFEEAVVPLSELSSDDGHRVKEPKRAKYLRSKPKLVPKPKLKSKEKKKKTMVLQEREIPKSIDVIMAEEKGAVAPPVPTSPLPPADTLERKKNKKAAQAKRQKALETLPYITDEIKVDQPSVVESQEDVKLNTVIETKTISQPDVIMQDRKQQEVHRSTEELLATDIEVNNQLFERPTSMNLESSEYTGHMKNQDQISYTNHPEQGASEQTEEPHTFSTDSELRKMDRPRPYLSQSSVEPDPLSTKEDLSYAQQPSQNIIEQDVPYVMNDEVKVSDAEAIESKEASLGMTQNSYTEMVQVAAEHLDIKQSEQEAVARDMSLTTEKEECLVNRPTSIIQESVALRQGEVHETPKTKQAVTDQNELSIVENHTKNDLLEGGLDPDAVTIEKSTIMLKSEVPEPTTREPSHGPLQAIPEPELLAVIQDVHESDEHRESITSAEPILLSTEADRVLIKATDITKLQPEQTTRVQGHNDEEVQDVIHDHQEEEAQPSATDNLNNTTMQTQPEKHVVPQKIDEIIEDNGIQYLQQDVLPQNVEGMEHQERQEMIAQPEQVVPEQHLNLDEELGEAIPRNGPRAASLDGILVEDPMVQSDDIQRLQPEQTATEQERQEETAEEARLLQKLEEAHYIQTDDLQLVTKLQTEKHVLPIGVQDNSEETEPLQSSDVSIHSQAEQVSPEEVPHPCKERTGSFSVHVPEQTTQEHQLEADIVIPQNDSLCCPENELEQVCLTQTDDLEKHATKMQPEKHVLPMVDDHLQETKVLQFEGIPDDLEAEVASSEQVLHLDKEGKGSISICVPEQTMQEQLHDVESIVDEVPKDNYYVGDVTMECQKERVEFTQIEQKSIEQSLAIKIEKIKPTFLESPDTNELRSMGIEKGLDDETIATATKEKEFIVHDPHLSAKEPLELQTQIQPESIILERPENLSLDQQTSLTLEQPESLLSEPPKPIPFESSDTTDLRPIDIDKRLDETLTTTTGEEEITGHGLHLPAQELCELQTKVQPESLTQEQPDSLSLEQQTSFTLQQPENLLPEPPEPIQFESPDPVQLSSIDNEKRVGDKTSTTATIDKEVTAHDAHLSAHDSFELQTQVQPDSITLERPESLFLEQQTSSTLQQSDTTDPRPMDIEKRLDDETSTTSTIEKEVTAHDPHLYAHKPFELQTHVQPESITLGQPESLSLEQQTSSTLQQSKSLLSEPLKPIPFESPETTQLSSMDIEKRPDDTLTTAMGGDEITGHDSHLPAQEAIKLQTEVQPEGITLEQSESSSLEQQTSFTLQHPESLLSELPKPIQFKPPNTTQLSSMDIEKRLGDKTPITTTEEKGVTVHDPNLSAQEPLELQTQTQPESIILEQPENLSLEQQTSSILQQPESLLSEPHEPIPFESSDTTQFSSIDIEKRLHETLTTTTAEDEIAGLDSHFPAQEPIELQTKVQPEGLTLEQSESISLEQQTSLTLQQPESLLSEPPETIPFESPDTSDLRPMDIDKRPDETLTTTTGEKEITGHDPHLPAQEPCELQTKVQPESSTLEQPGSLSLEQQTSFKLQQSESLLPEPPEHIPFQSPDTTQLSSMDIEKRPGDKISTTTTIEKEVTADDPHLSARDSFELQTQVQPESITLEEPESLSLEQQTSLTLQEPESLLSEPPKPIPFESRHTTQLSSIDIEKRPDDTLTNTTGEDEITGHDSHLPAREPIELQTKVQPEGLTLKQPESDSLDQQTSLTLQQPKSLLSVPPEPIPFESSDTTDPRPMDIVKRPDETLTTTTGEEEITGHDAHLPVQEPCELQTKVQPESITLEQPESLSLEQQTSFTLQQSESLLPEPPEHIPFESPDTTQLSSMDIEKRPDDTLTTTMVEDEITGHDPHLPAQEPIELQTQVQPESITLKQPDSASLDQQTRLTLQQPELSERPEPIQFESPDTARLSSMNIDKRLNDKTLTTKTGEREVTVHDHHLSAQEPFEHQTQIQPECFTLEQPENVSLEQQTSSTLQQPESLFFEAPKPKPFESPDTIEPRPMDIQKRQDETFATTAEVGEITGHDPQILAQEPFELQTKVQTESLTLEQPKNISLKQRTRFTLQPESLLPEPPKLIPSKCPDTIQSSSMDIRKRPDDKTPTTTTEGKEVTIQDLHVSAHEPQTQIQPESIILEEPESLSLGQQTSLTLQEPESLSEPPKPIPVTQFQPESLTLEQPESLSLEQQTSSTLQQPDDETEDSKINVHETSFYEGPGNLTLQEPGSLMLESITIEQTGMKVEPPQNNTIKEPEHPRRQAGTENVMEQQQELVMEQLQEQQIQLVKEPEEILKLKPDLEQPEDIHSQEEPVLSEKPHAVMGQQEQPVQEICKIRHHEHEITELKQPLQQKPKDDTHQQEHLVSEIPKDEILTERPEPIISQPEQLLVQLEDRVSQKEQLFEEVSNGKIAYPEQLSKQSSEQTMHTLSNEELLQEPDIKERSEHSVSHQDSMEDYQPEASELELEPSAQEQQKGTKPGQLPDKRPRRNRKKRRQRKSETPSTSFSETSTSDISPTKDKDEPEFNLQAGSTEVVIQSMADEFGSKISMTLDQSPVLDQQPPLPEDVKGLSEDPNGIREITQGIQKDELSKPYSIERKDEIVTIETAHRETFTDKSQTMAPAMQTEQIVLPQTINFPNQALLEQQESVILSTPLQTEDIGGLEESLAVMKVRHESKVSETVQSSLMDEKSEVRKSVIEQSIQEISVSEGNLIGQTAEDDKSLYYMESETDVGFADPSGMERAAKSSPVEQSVYEQILETDMRLADTDASVFQFHEEAADMKKEDIPEFDRAVKGDQIEQSVSEVEVAVEDSIGLTAEESTDLVQPEHSADIRSEEDPDYEIATKQEWIEQKTWASTLPEEDQVKLTTDSNISEIELLKAMEDEETTIQMGKVTQEQRVEQSTLELESPDPFHMTLNEQSSLGFEEEEAAITLSDRTNTQKAMLQERVEQTTLQKSLSKECLIQQQMGESAGPEVVETTALSAVEERHATETAALTHPIEQCTEQIPLSEDERVSLTVDNPDDSSLAHELAQGRRDSLADILETQPLSLEQPLTKLDQIQQLVHEQKLEQATEEDPVPTAERRDSLADVLEAEPPKLEKSSTHIDRVQQLASEQLIDLSEPQPLPTTDKDILSADILMIDSPKQPLVRAEKIKQFVIEQEVTDIMQHQALPVTERRDSLADVLITEPVSFEQPLVESGQVEQLVIEQKATYIAEPEVLPETEKEDSVPEILMAELMSVGQVSLQSGKVELAVLQQRPKGIIKSEVSPVAKNVDSTTDIQMTEPASLEQALVQSEDVEQLAIEQKATDLTEPKVLPLTEGRDSVADILTAELSRLEQPVSHSERVEQLVHVPQASDLTMPTLMVDTVRQDSLADIWMTEPQSLEQTARSIAEQTHENAFSHVLDNTNITPSEECKPSDDLLKKLEMHIVETNQNFTKEQEDQSLEVQQLLAEIEQLKSERGATYTSKSKERSLEGYDPFTPPQRASEQSLEEQYTLRSSASESSLCKEFVAQVSLTEEESHLVRERLAAASADEAEQSLVSFQPISSGTSQSLSTIEQLVQEQSLSSDFTEEDSPQSLDAPHSVESAKYSPDANYMKRMIIRAIEYTDDPKMQKQYETFLRQTPKVPIKVAHKKNGKQTEDGYRTKKVKKRQASVDLLDCNIKIEKPDEEVIFMPYKTTEDVRREVVRPVSMDERQLQDVLGSLRMSPPHILHEGFREQSPPSDSSRYTVREVTDVADLTSVRKIESDPEEQVFVPFKSIDDHVSLEYVDSPSDSLSIPSITTGVQKSPVLKRPGAEDENEPQKEAVGGTNTSSLATMNTSIMYSQELQYQSSSTLQGYVTDETVSIPSLGTEHFLPPNIVLDPEPDDGNIANDGEIIDTYRQAFQIQDPWCPGDVDVSGTLSSKSSDLLSPSPMFGDAHSTGRVSDIDDMSYDIDADNISTDDLISDGATDDTEPTSPQLQHMVKLNTSKEQRQRAIKVRSSKIESSTISTSTATPITATTEKKLSKGMKTKRMRRFVERWENTNDSSSTSDDHLDDRSDPEDGNNDMGDELSPWPTGENYEFGGESLIERQLEMLKTNDQQRDSSPEVELLSEGQMMDMLKQENYIGSSSISMETLERNIEENDRLTYPGLVAATEELPMMQNNIGLSSGASDTDKAENVADYDTMLDILYAQNISPISDDSDSGDVGLDVGNTDVYDSALYVKDSMTLQYGDSYQLSPGGSISHQQASHTPKTAISTTISNIGSIEQVSHTTRRHLLMRSTSLAEQVVTVRRNGEVTYDRMVYGWPSIERCEWFITAPISRPTITLHNYSGNDNGGSGQANKSGNDKTRDLGTRNGGDGHASPDRSNRTQEHSSAPGSGGYGGDETFVSAEEPLDHHCKMGHHDVNHHQISDYSLCSLQTQQPYQHWGQPLCESSHTTQVTPISARFHFDGSGAQNHMMSAFGLSHSDGYSRQCIESSYSEFTQEDACQIDRERSHFTSNNKGHHVLTVSMKPYQSECQLTPEKLGLIKDRR